MGSAFERLEASGVRVPWEQKHATDTEAYVVTALELIDLDPAHASQAYHPARQAAYSVLQAFQDEPLPLFDDAEEEAFVDRFMDPRDPSYHYSRSAALAALRVIEVCSGFIDKADFQDHYPGLSADEIVQRVDQHANRLLEERK